MEMMIQQPVAFTGGAVKELKRLLRDDATTAGKKLRVGVKGGGCSGMTYVLQFDIEQPGDIPFEIEGVHCIISPAHEMYLYGMEVEWEGGLNSRGFTFSNPNATKTCGCGTSFAV